MNRWYLNLILFQCPGNLIWSVSIHCHVKDSPYNYSCFFINDPYIRIILVFQIPIRCCTCHMLAGFPFRLESGFYLFTGIPCIPFIHDISEWSKIIVLPEAVYILVDCNQADIFLSQQLHILSDFQIISSHSAHIFNQNRSDFPRLYFFHHGKKAWAIKSCTGDTIISKMNKIGKSMFFCILFQQFLLV